MNIQDAFINQIRTQQIPITVKLLSGEEINGIVRGFDPSVIVLDIENRQNIVYKHSISLIEPHQTLDLFNNREKENEAVN